MSDVPVDQLVGEFGDYLSDSRPSLVDEIIADQTSGITHLFGFKGRGSKVFFSAAFYGILSQKELNQSAVLVCDTNAKAESLAQELTTFLPAEEVCYFPGWGTIPYDFVQPAPDHEMFRVRTYARVLSGRRSIIATSVEALLRKVPPVSELRGLEFKAGEEYDIDDICRQLAVLGYSREDKVETYGHFARKGDILDIYGPFSDNPIRLDFFDTFLDKIKVFDPVEQTSLENLETTAVLPRRELLLGDEHIGPCLEAAAEATRSGLELPVEWDDFESRLRAERHIPGLEELFPIFMPSAAWLEMFPTPPKMLWFDYDESRRKAEGLRSEFDHLYQTRSGEIWCSSPETLLVDSGTQKEIFAGGFQLDALAKDEQSIELPFKSAPEFKGRLSAFRQAVATMDEAKGAKGSEKKKKDPKQQSNNPAPSPSSSTSSRSSTSPDPNQPGDLPDLPPGVDDGPPEQAAQFYAEEFFPPGPNHRLIVVSAFTAQRDRLSGLLKSDRTRFAVAPLSGGFSLPNLGIHFWTDAAIFGRVYRRKTRFKKSTSRLIDSFLDLNVGDPVVHVHHGIGIFQGLKRIEAAGKERDFLVLKYKDDGILYVPLDQMSLVQRYIGSGGAASLDKLGSNRWKKTKERVAKEIDKLAGELVEIYSARRALKGYTFPPDTAWQEEFEAAFEYEETPDQLRTIDDIKNDMESDRPMDRLVCGDVGYGKTEVAIRAAFKAVMAGKQVAFIAPTTILALQHFKNLARRFENYPIKVDWISRFRTAGEVKDIKKAMLDGEIDIIVGTHAIINTAAYMKNLGLLVVDEEQRFGVGHKEAIKKIKKLVDVLTLTATPIPRTLHMSLVGIRDLSIINTPPSNRSRVETYVMEDNDEILKDAIGRELDRGGQVYYLHNRVESIELQEARLRALLPNATIAILHGQLPENEIEDTLLEFQKGAYQILVTTTIIESGIDIPNVNTLIVNRAGMFGLSQLYQIKGRVGRSARKAYAYFFYNKDTGLTEVAMKRLSTLQEYQELGSGFKVAMRDLEIRGAGNLLGKEQSGQIMDVGFDLYVQMLSQAVAKLKGDRRPPIRSSINLHTDLYIPDDYISDAKQKVEFYQRMERSEEDAEVDAIRNEMEDRFGRLPDVVETLVSIEKIRVLASRLGIENVYEEKGRIGLTVHKEHNIDPEKLVEIIAGGGDFTLDPDNNNVFYLKKKGGDEDARLRFIEKALYGLL